MADNYKAKEDGTGGAGSSHERMRNAYKILYENPGGKRQLGRTKLRWKNIKMYLMKIGLGGVIMDSPVSECGYETSGCIYSLQFL
jgi:hypothetical protein